MAVDSKVVGAFVQVERQKVYDPDTMTWVAEQQATGGGGGSTGGLTNAQLRAADVKITLDGETVPVTDGGGSLTVDGTVIANLGTLNGAATSAKQGYRQHKSCESRHRLATTAG
jgi:hypothetical protein